MKTTIAFAFLSLVLGFTSTAHAATVTFDWATIGDPGNAGDVQVGGTFGSVANTYRISKTEVTNAQYTKFLNAVDPTGDNLLGLFNSQMANNFGGIESTGATDGSRYVAQTGREQNPVTFVSFFDAMRFTNWLHNGQGSGDTESGAYTIDTGTNEVRSASASFWIPSEDEWYKAAYYDPNRVGGPGYNNYATGSDTIPVSDQPGDNPAAANYFNDDGLANGFNDGFVNSTGFPSNTNPFTDVGAYTDAASPYGTYDQNGNVAELNDSSFISGIFRGLRGGNWDLPGLISDTLSAETQLFIGPSSEFSTNGFRVASAIPEPSTLLLGALASLGLLIRRRR